MFQITHPFHPRRGQDFVLVTRKQNWGEDRVMYFDPAGTLRSLPTSWTSAQTLDSFQQCSAGRSWFRVDDLLELTALVQTVKEARLVRRAGVK